MKRISLLFPLFFLLIGCNITFFLNDGWEESTMGATALDTELIFRQEYLRGLHREGKLSEDENLHETESLAYYIQTEGSSFYVTFFGTSNVTGVYYDMVHWKEPFWTDVDPEIRVHAGFNRPFQTVATSIRDELQLFLDTNPVDPSVYILGHSSGGIQAVLCSFYLVQEIPETEISTLYCQTGGAPAPGNRNFAAAFNQESRITCHRYINGSDMVPSLFTPEMGYAHVGQPYRIGSEPNFMISSTGLWLGDHFIEDYAESLR